MPARSEGRLLPKGGEPAKAEAVMGCPLALTGRIRSGEENQRQGQPRDSQAGLWGQGRAQDISLRVMPVSAGPMAGQGLVVAGLETNSFRCPRGRAEDPRGTDTASGTMGLGGGPWGRCSGPLRPMNTLRALTFSVLTTY